MKKVLALLVPMIVLAESVEEIVKNIDVKKTVEEYLELNAGILHSPSFSDAQRYMYLYETMKPFQSTLRKILRSHFEKDGSISPSEKALLAYIPFYVTHSTHIAIGMVTARDTETVYEYYKTKFLLKILHTFRGDFQKDTMMVRVTTGPNVISQDGIDHPYAIGDTLLLFLQTIPWGYAYNQEHGSDFNYKPGWFTIAGVCGMWLITGMRGEKRILGCPGEEVNFTYDEMINTLNFLIPICEAIKKEVKKYKFPITIEEYGEFMKKKGYNFPLTDEDIEKIQKKFKKRQERLK